MNKSLSETAIYMFSEPGERSKSLHCYDIYEKFFSVVRDNAVNLFEVGVFNGESAKVFSRYFQKSMIVGIDHILKDIELSGYDNVKLFQGDQSDADFLLDLVQEYFPAGIDIIVDDASHIGSLSKSTFEILFPHLKSGGIYVIEDWGTGYWGDWIDGGLYENYQAQVFHRNQFVKRIPTHDFGMVGFIKHVVDLVGMSDNRPTFSEPQQVVSQIKAMHVYPGTVVLEKA